MRRISFGAAFALALIANSRSAQESYPIAKAIQNEAFVRSGPDESFTPTTKLSAGAKVDILKPALKPDWYEIKPPHDSYSWINASKFKLINKNGFVDVAAGEFAEVRAGSRLTEKKPETVTAKLTAGTVIVVIDRPLTINGETWYPIMPHPSEVRYIHKSAFDANTTKVSVTKEIELQEEVARLRQRVDVLEKKLDQLEKRKKKK